MHQLQEIDPQVELSIANSIWYNKSFDVLQSFLDNNVEYYNAKVQALDFANPESVNIINKWVAEKTKNKITEIIEEIPSGTVMYLVNAVYFYGEWKFEFDPEDTHESVFYLANNATINTDMMQMQASLKYYRDADLTIVELP